MHAKIKNQIYPLWTDIPTDIDVKGGGLRGVYPLKLSPPQNEKNTLDYHPQIFETLHFTPTK